jgi:hypothetical protein
MAGERTLIWTLLDAVVVVVVDDGYSPARAWGLCPSEEHCLLLVLQWWGGPLGSALGAIDCGGITKQIGLGVAYRFLIASQSPRECQ